MRDSISGDGASAATPGTLRTVRDGAIRFTGHPLQASLGLMRAHYLPTDIVKRLPFLSHPESTIHCRTGRVAANNSWPGHPRRSIHVLVPYVLALSCYLSRITSVASVEEVLAS